MALTASGTTCRLREIVLRDKPDEMLAASPKGTVPVVVLPDDTVIDESLDVMQWSLGQNDPEDWLHPASGTIDEMMTLIGQCDEPFKHNLDRYKYDTRYPGEKSSDHREEGLRFLELLNGRLHGQSFLFGDRACLADVAIFPFIRQFANTDRNWFDALPLPELQDWLASWLDSEAFSRVMTKFPLWKKTGEEGLF
jgi:glutathione S-transferase